MIIWGAAALEDDAFIAGIFELGLSITLSLLGGALTPPCRTAAGDVLLPTLPLIASPAPCTSPITTRVRLGGHWHERPIGDVGSEEPTDAAAAARRGGAQNARQNPAVKW
jgi:hypothetical protein